MCNEGVLLQHDRANSSWVSLQNKNEYAATPVEAGSHKVTE